MDTNHTHERKKKEKKKKRNNCMSVEVGIMCRNGAYFNRSLFGMYTNYY